MPTLMLRPVNTLVYGVYDGGGIHVGNLKRIGNVWKFKAIGYDADGAVEPGGGPLTNRHNTEFDLADADTISAVLLAPAPA